MLGRGVGRRVRARRMRRDRAVVDDASAARVLVLHHPERLLHAEEHAGQVDVHDVPPLLDGQVLEWYARGADAGVVEQQVQAAEGLLRLREQRLHRLRIAHVGRHRQRPRACARVLHGLLQRILAPSRERDAVPVLQERERYALADAAACARNDGYLVLRAHTLLLLKSVRKGRMLPHRAANFPGREFGRGRRL